MREIVLIAHNLRSCHNVGSLLRTAEGLGVSKVYLVGYTPYPAGQPDDPRLPHEALKLTKQIHKTALDAENQIAWEHVTAIEPVIEHLHTDGYQVMAVEQAGNATALPNFMPSSKIALLMGREVEGVE